MASGTVIQFPLRLGLADDANKKSAPTSSLKRGHNVRWARDGVIGKRFGFAELGAATAAPLRLVTRGDTLSFTDGKKLYTYSPTTGQWAESDRVGEVGLEWSTLLDDAAGVAQSDIVIRGSVLLHAYVTGDPSLQAGSASDSIFSNVQCLQAIDWQTGRVLLSSATQIQGGEFMRLLLCGSYGVLLTSSGTQLFAYRVQLDESIGIALDPTATVLATDVRNDADPHGIKSRFDACVLSDGSVALAYECATGIIVKKFSVAAGLLTATASSLAETTQTGVRCISISELVAGGTIFCAYSRIVSDPECRIFVFTAASSDLAQITAPAQVDSDFFGHHISVLGITASQALIVYSGVRGIIGFPTSWPETASVLFDVSIASPVALTQRRSAGVMMTSSVFTVENRKYVFARDAHYGEKQHWDPTWTDGIIFGKEFDETDLSKLPSMSSYLVEIEYDVHSGLYATVPHRVVGKIDHDIAAPFKQGFTSRAASVDGFTVLGSTPFQATAEPQSFGFRAGLRLVTATTDLARRADPWRCVNIATETYIGGSGMLWAWDGRSVFDLAMRTPMILSAGENSNDGKMAEGSYLYQTHAEYRSHAGILHRGPLSITVTVGLIDATDHLASAKLVIQANSIDCKESNALGFGTAAALKSYINIFRSEVGPGSILYERTFGPRFDFFLNRPELTPQTFTDVLGDEDIAFNEFAPTDAFSNPQVPLASRPQPYTATGELEDVQPPAPLTMCLHGGRILSLAGDRRTVWFTKAYEDNPGIAPGFNPDFVRIFDRDVYAIASFADRAIFFFERGARFMVGDGPTVSNTDDRFSTPQSLQGEIGTTNPRSVVATPAGVFFQATGGEIYLLDGGLSMQWVGKDVREQLVTYPTITSAVHVAEHREVRFTASNGTTGIMLVFDYQRGTWMTRSLPGDAPVTDACMWDGQYVFATAAGVFRETATHDDDGAYVPSSIVLNSIAPRGSMSWHRIRLVQLIGTSLAAHNLTVSLARDYAAATEQTETWNGSSSVTAPGPLERAQVAPRIQKMQAIEIHIDDAAPTYDSGSHDPVYDGFKLEGVALLVDGKSGTARIEKGKRG